MSNNIHGHPSRGCRLAGLEEARLNLDLRLAACGSLIEDPVLTRHLLYQKYDKEHVDQKILALAAKNSTIYNQLHEISHHQCAVCEGVPFARQAHDIGDFYASSWNMLYEARGKLFTMETLKRTIDNNGFEIGQLVGLSKANERFHQTYDLLTADERVGHSLSQIEAGNCICFQTSVIDGGDAGDVDASDINAGHVESGDINTSDNTTHDNGSDNDDVSIENGGVANTGNGDIGLDDTGNNNEASGSNTVVDEQDLIPVPSSREASLSPRAEGNGNSGDTSRNSDGENKQPQLPQLQDTSTGSLLDVAILEEVAWEPLRPMNRSIPPAQQPLFPNPLCNATANNSVDVTAMPAHIPAVFVSHVMKRTAVIFKNDVECIEAERFQRKLNNFRTSYVLPAMFRYGIQYRPGAGAGSLMGLTQGPGGGGEGGQGEDECRMVILKNLRPTTTLHKVLKYVRGGAVHMARCIGGTAAITFVEASAARAYVYNLPEPTLWGGLLIDGERVEVMLAGTPTYPDEELPNHIELGHTRVLKIVKFPLQNLHLIETALKDHKDWLECIAYRTQKKEEKEQGDKEDETEVVLDIENSGWVTTAVNTNGSSSASATAEANHEEEVNDTTNNNTVASTSTQTQQPQPQTQNQDLVDVMLYFRGISYAVRIREILLSLHGFYHSEVQYADDPCAQPLETLNCIADW